MKSKTIFLLFFSVCFTQNQSLPNSIDHNHRASDGDVIYASILFRHGDRTPNRLIPTEPHELSYWKEGVGELTEVGKLHAYELGKWIRQEYRDLISDQPYRYDVITVNCSDSNRTLMSAELFLAGLYPPSDEEMWNSENLRWQPIPVHMIPLDTDNVLSFPNNICERYELEIDSLSEDPKFIALLEENRDLLEYVSIHSGFDIPKDDVYDAFDNLYSVYDTLSIEVENNRTLQNWTRRVFPQPLKFLADLHLPTLTYTDEMKRLRGGPLLKSIIADMTRKATNDLKNTKFHLYSGHDTTVSTLLDTLGVSNGTQPPYTATVIVELRKKYETHFVRVLYRNSSLVAPYILKIPGCESEVCSLDEFIRVTASRIPDDWEAECKVGFLSTLFRKFPFKEFVVLAIVVLFLVALITTLGRRYFGTSYKQYETIQGSKSDDDGPHSPC